jgi:hypothetical protein
MAAGASATSAKANEIAERLIGLMRSAESSPKASAFGEELPLDEMLQNFLRQQLETSSRLSVSDVRDLSQMTIEASSELAATCIYDTSPHNPGFWNKNPLILQSWYSLHWDSVRVQGSQRRQVWDRSPINHLCR